MYNAERKTLWLQSMHDAAGVQSAKAFLDRLDVSVEDVLSEDLFELVSSGRKADAIRALEENGRFFNYLTLRRFCAYANAYLTWCYATIRSEVAPQHVKLTAYDVALVPAFATAFIRTQQELSAALEDMPLEEGYLLPVCCSLAWMGYSVKEMCGLKRSDAAVVDETVYICGEAAPAGFVNDTLRMWTEREVFFRGLRGVAYAKTEGDDFVRWVFPAEGVYTKITDRVHAIRKLASRCVVRRTGDTISYRQLTAAGEFQKLRSLEASGQTVDLDAVRRVCGVSGQNATDRLNEYRQFCLSLRP